MTTAKCNIYATNTNTNYNTNQQRESVQYVTISKGNVRKKKTSSNTEWLSLALEYIVYVLDRPAHIGEKWSARA